MKQYKYINDIDYGCMTQQYRASVIDFLGKKLCNCLIRLLTSLIVHFDLVSNSSIYSNST